ncbi:ribokinase [Streptobacillus felis]|uniref:Ribokinase n=1 Tax=Streptobacillus felis TaxID=1384509 RepID=A0A7Z0PGK1_9FUSO|nr:ribokinase [Streptobacillus felis]NYV28366.1 ribokinase [Streptobacillus felis]
MKKALIVGSLNMDITARVDQLPKLGETIFGTSFYKSCGGKGANQAVAISKMGIETIMLGMVGNDSDGYELIENLSKHNIKSSVIVSNEITGRAIITVDNNGNNNIIVIPGANFKITKEDIDKKMDIINEVDVVILQNEIPLDITKYVLKKSKELNKITVFNPAPAYKFEKEIYENVDFLILNETEFEFIFDVKYNDTNAILSIKDKFGISNLLLTLGELGSILFTNNNILVQEALKVKAIDTTAAGDAFIGSFISKIINNNSLESALKFATTVSAIVVTKKGAQESIPTLDEVNEYIIGVN